MVFDSMRTNDRTVLPAGILPGEKRSSRTAGDPEPRLPARRVAIFQNVHYATSTPPCLRNSRLFERKRAAAYGSGGEL
jgi:hypothetical protein